MKWRSFLSLPHCPPGLSSSCQMYLTGSLSSGVGGPNNSSTASKISKQNKQRVTHKNRDTILIRPSCLIPNKLPDALINCKDFSFQWWDDVTQTGQGLLRRECIVDIRYDIKFLGFSGHSEMMPTTKRTEVIMNKTSSRLGLHWPDSSRILDPYEEGHQDSGPITISKEGKTVTGMCSRSVVNQVSVLSQSVSQLSWVLIHVGALLFFSSSQQVSTS